MSSEQKHIKVYLEDWNQFNRWLSLKQVESEGRLSFAELFHDVVENYVTPQIAKAINKLERAAHAI